MMVKPDCESKFDDDPSIVRPPSLSPSLSTTDDKIGISAHIASLLLPLSSPRVGQSQLPQQVQEHYMKIAI